MYRDKSKLVNANYEVMGAMGAASIVEVPNAAPDSRRAIQEYVVGYDSSREMGWACNAETAETSAFFLGSRRPGSVALAAATSSASQGFEQLAFGQRVR
mmetsp:Transcript_32317/g.69191  ORF Transcript_32317/g.69191 Transcript_32317/m.69191 type:complete len:99 (+) Transcript_32317:45-341(+)